MRVDSPDLTPRTSHTSLVPAVWLVRLTENDKDAIEEYEET